MKRFFVFFVIFFSFFYKNALAIDKNVPEFVFLSSINDMTASFLQTEDTGKKIVKSTGSIIVKKPDKVLLNHDGENLKLKVISINGNIKMIDKDIGQATYMDNSYTELIQFFTKNLKPEKLTINNNRELCIDFEKFGSTLNACLKIDLSKQTLSYIKIYKKDRIVQENKQKNKNIKDKFILYEIVNIMFQKVDINQGVDDGEFFIKDSRIFDDDEE